MISHAEHENLVAGSVEAGRVLYVCMPAAVCALVVLVASAAHVFTVASSMGFVLVGLVVFRVVMAGAHDAISLESFDVMGDMKKSHAEVSEKLLAGADDQLHADLVYSMESYVSTKNAAQMGCNIAKAVSNIAAAVAIGVVHGRVVRRQAPRVRARPGVGEVARGGGEGALGVEI